MQVEFFEKNNKILISLGGELDEHEATNVRKCLDDRLINSNCNIVIFDLEKLTFMDSTGIGVLIGRYKLLKQRGISAFIKSPRTNVDKVLNLTGIYAIMPKID